MVTLEAGAKYTNVMKSVYAYLDSNIGITLGYTIYYMGAGRIGALPQQWVEADLIPTDAVQEARIAGYQSFSIWVECYLNLNCFEKRDSGHGLTNIYSLSSMVDSIRPYIEFNSNIELRDYDTVGSPKVGALRVLEKPTINHIATDPAMGIDQMNISVPLRHHEVTIA